MKFVVVLLLCISLSLGFEREKKKAHEIAKILLKDCMGKEGGSENDLDKLSREEIPDTEVGKCMIACAYEKLRIVSLVLKR